MSENAPTEFARRVGAPVLQASHCGRFRTDLGVLKYAQLSQSSEAMAHPYVGIAHRAALMYSFAIMLIAVCAGFVHAGL